MNTDFWNDRYQQNDSVYGEEPNEFFKEQLLLLKPGKLLLPADGEGRNSIYAASIGWEVDAFDFSEVARSKALNLAKKKSLTIHYSIENIETISLPENKYDAVGLIYVHLNPKVRRIFFQKCIQALKPGGKIIMEVFNQKQINNTSGGPKDALLLYSTQDAIADFADLQIEYCKDFHGHLNEGSFHSGAADVVRMVGRK